jgi:hypothetical protein
MGRSISASLNMNRKTLRPGTVVQQRDESLIFDRSFIYQIGLFYFIASKRTKAMLKLAEM